MHATSRSSAFFAEVVDAVHVTGPYDYLLRVRVRDTSALDRLLRLLKKDAGVAQTQTRLALRSPSSPSPAPAASGPARP
ncbi:Lrp/AsnC ligand binding domain-containing protein [Leucobacter triazinivorans]|uniref:Lrp/AsnC family transcriptional regulator n=1 Tax=Leucobacter triazinivorans TaxID=1784719 RepID=A0A4P6KET2_9MICO|nr:Lrp/AsnC ligand binding domain-containing protein [Leucobacter triazinivorans]QBE48887.1 Lrp/AsnC family transcriptional regulator [Leucobacter triazinivorans]